MKSGENGVELHRLTSPVTTVIICKFDTDGWNGCQNKSNATERKCSRTPVSELISFKFVLRASPFCLPFLRRCTKRFRHKLLIPHCKFTRDFFALLSDSDFFNPFSLPLPSFPPLSGLGKIAAATQSRQHTSVKNKYSLYQEKWGARILLLIL